MPSHKLGAQLVVEVRALVGNLGVLDSYEQSGMDSVLRAFARPREAPLEAIQPPLGLLEELRVWNLHAVRGRYQ